MENRLCMRDSFKKFAELQMEKSEWNETQKKVMINIEKWIEKNDVNSFVELDEYIHETRASKETASQIIISFSEACHSMGESFGETRLIHSCIIDDPTRRSIEIVKYLHTKRSLHEIMNHFAISDRTVRKIMKSLQNGISIMGCYLNARVLKKKGSYILQTFTHPIFVGLDRAELVSLMEVMNREQEDPLYGVFIGRIKNQITRQLTDTAKELSNGFVTIEEDISAEKLDEEEAGIAVKATLIEMLHSGNPGNITIYTSADEIELNHCTVKSYDYRSGLVTIVREDGYEIEYDVDSIAIVTLLNQP